MTRYHKLLGMLATALLSALAACTHPDPPPPGPILPPEKKDSHSATDPIVPPSPPFATSTKRELSAQDMKDVNQAAEGLTAFASNLYAEMRSEKGNLFVSPYSIGMALALTAAGSQGETYEQIQRVFHFPSRETLAQTYGNLAEAIMAPPKNANHIPELNTANSLWIQKGHPFRKDYLDLVSTKLNAGIFEVDYVTDREDARRRVNQWVEKQTHNRIQDLVPRDALDSATTAVLANAIFFKAQWLESFEKVNTMPSDFTCADRKKIKVPLMYQMEHFELLENDKLQVLRLPYDGKTLSMYVVLPRSDQLPNVEKELTPSTLRALTTGNWDTSEVKVWLPKFKFTIPTELAPTLQSMGIVDAFIDIKANFRGMSDHPNGLYISRVIHKAFVEVNEAGTEAAAATAAIMTLASSPPPTFIPPQPPKIFRADHPFLFVIKHEATGAILFMGRVEDPTK
jgi:serpin B